jgi:hypothetical protein
MAIYAIIWIILIGALILAAWRKRWGVMACYAAGALAFLFTVLQDKSGWDDLADLAALMVVTAPLYLIGTLIWVALAVRGRKAR